MFRRWLLAVLLFLGLAAAIIVSESPSGSLSGRVVDTTGAIITDPSAQVIAYGPVVRGVYLGADGEYTLDRLPVGDYRVRATAAGYQSEILVDSIQVQEGHHQRLAEGILERKPPNLTLFSTSQVFTTQEIPQMTMRVSGVSRVKFELYAFQLTDFLGRPELEELADPYGYAFTGSDLITATPPIRTWEQPIRVDSEDGWTAMPIPLSNLTAGAYWLKATGISPDPSATRVASHWFSVTDLGLIQKIAPDQVLIQAINLSTQQPIADATIRLFAAVDATPQVQQTDTDGLVTFSSLPEQAASDWVVVGETANQEFSTLSSLYHYGFQRDTLFYTYTDRPIYRPGQTVYFRSVIRQLDPQLGPQLPAAGTPVTIRVSQPNDDSIYTDTLTLNEFGTIHGSFELPVEGDLGSYQLRLSLDDRDLDYHWITVEEYRKPEFNVTVNPNQSWVIQGDSVEVTTRADYLFGGPVAQAQVHYIVYRSSDYSFQYSIRSRTPEEEFFSQYQTQNESYYGGYGEVIAEGDTVTDSGGVARFQLDHILNKFDWTPDQVIGSVPVQQLRIEVQVTDISRRAVTQDGRLRVVPGNLALFMQKDRYVAAPGDTVTYTIQSYNYDRQPVSVSQGQIRLELWQWNSRTESYRKELTLPSTSFKTDTGQGTVELTIPDSIPSGSYTLTFEAKDTKGHAITEVDWIYISGSESSGYRFGPHHQGLEIIADQTVYQIGDTAQIIVLSPIPDAVALVTVEGSTLYQAQVVQFEGTVAQLDLPILPAYQPNVEYHVTLIGPERQIYQGNTNILVSPLHQFLSVELQTDQEVYQPGETATITVQTRSANGAPVSAEVSLGVVDEAIYLLQPDTTPDIRYRFYQRRYNSVRTLYSFPQQYPGGADKLANQLRQDFQDTAAWFPTIVTDTNGLATVQVQLPDNVTTWRLTARATTADTQVGSVVDSIRVTKDLLVRLATPRFLRTDDQLLLSAVVQNQTDSPQRVQVNLTVPSTLSLQHSNLQRILIPAQGAKRLDWPATARAAGEAAIKVTVEGQTGQDAVQLTLPIQAYGYEFRSRIRGSLVQNQPETALLDLKMPEAVVPGSLSLNVELATQPVAELLGSLDYLVQYPYGCTEQTLSRFLPALALDQAIQTLGLSLQSTTLERLPATLERGLRRLGRQQNHDGGWGWWARDTSNPYLTSYVLLGFFEAETGDYAVNLEQIEQGLQFLEQAITEQQLNPDIEMFASYALSLFGRGDLNRVRQAEPATLSTFGQAYQALALVKMGDRDLAQLLFNALLNRIDLDSNVWYSPAANLDRGLFPWLRWSYRTPEIAGPTLEVATALKDPRAQLIADQILQAKQGSRWSTTKSTADAILGLVSYYQEQQQQQPQPAAIGITNQTTDARIGRWQPQVDDSHQVISLTPSDLTTETLQPDLQIIEIDKQGGGSLYYSLEATGIIPAARGSLIGGESQGFAVNRSYFTLVPETEGDRIVYREEPLRDPVKAGTTLLGRVTVEADRDMAYVMIEEPLPSGAEVTSQDPDVLTGNSDQHDYWWNWFWTQQTVRDDRITFFVTDLPQGTHEFVYLFRPEIPGAFSIPPTLAEEMYNPTEAFGQSFSHTLRVIE